MKYKKTDSYGLYCEFPCVYVNSIDFLKKEFLKFLWILNYKIYSNNFLSGSVDKTLYLNVLGYYDENKQIKAIIEIPLSFYWKVSDYKKLINDCWFKCDISQADIKFSSEIPNKDEIKKMINPRKKIVNERYFPIDKDEFDMLCSNHLIENNFIKLKTSFDNLRNI